MPSPALIILHPSSDGHPNRYKVLFLVLTCISLMTSGAEHVFIPVGHLYVFLWEMYIQVLSPFLIEFDFLLLIACVPYIFWVIIVYHAYGLQYSLLFPRICIPSCFFCSAEAFWFEAILFNIFPLAL